MYTQLLT